MANLLFILNHKFKISWVFFKLKIKDFLNKKLKKNRLILLCIDCNHRPTDCRKNGVMESSIFSNIEFMCLFHQNYMY